MKYYLLGAILSGILTEACCYFETPVLLTSVLKAVYLIFTLGFTFLLINFLSNSEPEKT